MRERLETAIACALGAGYFAVQATGSYDLRTATLLGFPVLAAVLGACARRVLRTLAIFALSMALLPALAISIMALVPDPPEVKCGMAAVIALMLLAASAVQTFAMALLVALVHGLLGRAQALKPNAG